MELGQMMFAQNNQSYECEGYVVALLKDIANEMSRIRQNNNDYTLPFSNDGSAYVGKTFEVRAYDWKEDPEYNYNFKYKDIEVSWYKHLGRGDTINRLISKEEAISMYNDCMKSLRKLEKKSNKYFT